MLSATGLPTWSTSSKFRNQEPGRSTSTTVINYEFGSRMYMPSLIAVSTLDFAAGSPIS